MESEEDFDGDRFTKYTYDTQMAGNPKYYGTFDTQGNFVSGITYTWDGRRLASLIDNTNATTVQYTYNDKGLRTKKTVNGVIHNYYYDNEMLVCEKYNDITKRFIYDENGMVTSFIFKNGTTENIYFYVRDIFGIINYLVDISGAIVVFYSYDSWGKLLSTGGTLSSTVGVQNPFLYKGYYFDFETSLYYCHSRYYNPMWRRYISPADVSTLNPRSINGLNLYTYADSNPIMLFYHSKATNSVTPISNISSYVTNGMTSSSSLSHNDFGVILSGLSNVFDMCDMVSSYGAGVIDGLFSYIGSSRLNGLQSNLNKFSNWMMGIGIGLDILSSAYSNFNNNNFSVGQQWGSFAADLGYIGVKTAISYGLGLLITQGSVALGSALGGAAITYMGASIVGGILIGGGIVIVGVVVGIILVGVLSDASDNWWKLSKENLFK